MSSLVFMQLPAEVIVHRPAGAILLPADIRRAGRSRKAVRSASEGKIDCLALLRQVTWPYAFSNGVRRGVPWLN